MRDFKRKAAAYFAAVVSFAFVMATIALAQVP